MPWLKPVTLVGKNIKLEPLSLEHELALREAV